MQPLSAAGAVAHGPGDARWPVSLVLTLPGERQALEPARLAVRDFLAPHSLSAQALFNVELVLEEALMNVVWHALHSAPGHHIGLQVQVERDHIVVQVDDDGIAFDPLQAVALPRPASIADAQPGGLGLQLVRQRASSLAYARRDGRNCLRIGIARI